MIGVVCLNPALDITHHAAAVDWAAVNRPSAVYTRPGGKGLNAVPPAVVAGNATGAGDAAAAGLAHGLALGCPWDERLRHAVALGTAAALAPVAGEFSPADYAAVRAGVTVMRAGDEAAGHGSASEAGVAPGEAC